jgi:hypothetical protein
MLLSPAWTSRGRPEPSAGFHAKQEPECRGDAGVPWDSFADGHTAPRRGTRDGLPGARKPWDRAFSGEPPLGDGRSSERFALLPYSSSAASASCHGVQSWSLVRLGPECEYPLDGAEDLGRNSGGGEGRVFGSCASGSLGVTCPAGILLRQRRLWRGPTPAAPWPRALRLLFGGCTRRDTFRPATLRWSRPSARRQGRSQCRVPPRGRW